MNTRLSNNLLLMALVVTLIAVVAVHFFPERRLVLLPSADGRFFLDSTRLADGSPSSEWLDERARKWRCNVPEVFTGSYFNCGIGIDLSKSATEGVDLSRYTHMTLHLQYKGAANRVRIAIRNFDPAYSTVGDANSGKFNSLQLHTKELGQPLKLTLQQFTVADWWIGQYNIPLGLSQPDLSNAIALTIDFGDVIPPGVHDLQLAQLEFSGELVSPENWYLGILAAWMFGILITTLRNMARLRIEAAQGVQLISHLSTTNAELRQETDRFRRLSTVDPLTQTYNRFGIDKIVATLMAASHDRYRETPNFALILVDIDHFKRINDRRGHDVGDRVLQRVSAIIQQNIRSVDFLGRWGGEEFLIIMPNTDKDYAIAMAEKIRVAIADAGFEPEQPLAVTASFGVSTQQPGEEFATTFKRADVALYRAKAQGRNCVIMAFNSLTEED